MINRSISVTFALLLTLGIVQAVSSQSPPLRFSDGSTKVTVPFKTADNLILVEASLNGEKGSFIFDTGAESTVVNASFAKRIGLTPKGTTVGSGSAGSATAGIIRGTTFGLGGIAVSGLTVYSLPIDEFAPALGFNIAGIIGNDVIGKLVAEIDYANTTLILHSPGSFVAPAAAQRVDLTIEGGLPFIMSTVELDARRSVPMKMEIDTGSTGAVLLNTPVVRKHRLLTTLPRYLDTKTGGVGGTGTSKIARITGVLFGRFEITEPITQLFTGSKGDNSSSRYDGLFGGAVFRRFKMTVDLPHKRLLLEPNDLLSEPFDTDMSGMELVADGEALNVISIDEVKPESAAAKAGIEEGDVLESVDGRTASELGIQAIRRIMRTAGLHTVVVRRNDKTLTITLNLKRVI